MAQQLCVDLYHCDETVINDLDAVITIAHNILDEMGTGIVKECYHRFEPIGITYIAVITTSHFSIHTWPEYQYVAVDIFSCSDELPDVLSAKLKEAFGAKRHNTRKFDRDIEGREQSEL